MWEHIRFVCMNTYEMHVCVHVCACECVCVCMCVYACVCVCMHLYIYIYIYVCVCVNTPQGLWLTSVVRFLTVPLEFIHPAHGVTCKTGQSIR